MTLLFVILLTILGLASYFLYYKPKRQVQKFGQMAIKAGYKVKIIPYNPLNFFVLNYLKQDDRSLKIYKEQLHQYDLIVGNLLNKLAILAIHPNILKDLFNQSSKLIKNPFFAKVYKLLTESGLGIGLAEGQEWKRKRRIISSVFHFDFLNHMIPTIHKETEKQFKKIDDKIENGQDVDLLVSFIDILSTLIIRIFFGTEVNETIEGQPFSEFFMQFLNEICEYSQSFERMVLGLNVYHFGLTSRARTLKKHIKILYAVAKTVTQKQLVKLKNGQLTERNILTTLYQNDMLDFVGINDPNKYTIDELIGEFFNFFGAGTDTTANTVNLVFHYLSQNPQYVEKISEELKELESKSLPDSQKLKNMKWIEAVFNQTLRLGGPAAGLFPRVADQKVTAGGLQIPAGTSVSVFSVINQHSPKYFEKPFDFYPQRWINNVSIQPYTYIPFSAGQRNCIGQYLSRVESKVLISKIIQKYRFKAKHPIKMHYKFAYATEHGDFEMSMINDSAEKEQ